VGPILHLNASPSLILDRNVASFNVIFCICIKIRWQWSTTGIWSTGESAYKLVAREAGSKGLYSWIVQLVPIVYCPYKKWISINFSISTFCAKAFVILQFMRCHNVCTLKVTKTCGSNSAFVWYWLKISGCHLNIISVLKIIRTLDWLNG
jgi:hypothetical protein